MCYFLVFGLYWNYLTTDRLHWMYASFSLNLALLVLQYSFFCCLWFTLLLRPYFKMFLCWDLSKVDGHTLSSILVFSCFICCLSISLLVFFSGCKDILDFLLCCIGECSCALKLGRIKLCCFDLLLCISLVIPIHIDSAVSAYSTQSLMEISLCLSSFNLEKLSFPAFEHSCVDILFAFFLHSIWLQVNYWITLVRIYLNFVCQLCIFMRYYRISLSIFFIFKLSSNVSVPHKYWHFYWAHIWILLLISGICFISYLFWSYMSTIIFYENTSTM